MRLQAAEVDSDEYGVLLERLGKLQKIRHEEKPENPTSDAILSSATNLIGIFMILRHEQLNVITSKATSFVRLR
jgi:hypothetical protein